jgi:ABC-2 type transport system permease protein
MQAGLFDPERFYFYLALADQEQTIMVALPDNFTKESLRENLEAGLKRFSSGYLKTVALAAPQQSGNPYLPPAKQFLALRQQLEANYNVRNLDLSQGNVPENVDILVVANPNEIDEKGLFAIDQFLMKGGTVLVAASAFDVQFEYQGLKLDDQLVLDSRNQPFPLPSTRNVGGFMIREMRLVPYPYFIDVRDEGLNQDIPVTAGLGRVMINWASPIELDETKTAELGHDWLLKSSPVSWTSDSTNLVPRVTQNGGAGFAPEGEQAGQLNQERAMKRIPQQM